MALFSRRRDTTPVLYKDASPDRVSARHNAVRAEMDRLRAEQPGSLTAAGELVQHGDATYLRRLIQAWQVRAMGYYDIVGPLKYAAQFYSRALAQLELFAGEIDEETGEVVRTKNEVVIDALARIKDPGGTGRTGLLANYGRLMFLVGEAYLLVTINQRTKLEQWEMLSTDEVRLIEGLYTRFKAPQLPANQFYPAPDKDFEPLADTAVAYRIWKRHPRWSSLADSSVMACLDILEEYVLLTQAVRARARSRLAGSGVLFIDDRITTTPSEAAPDEDPQEDPFLADLTEAMTKPIINEGTAGAVVPLVARVRVPEGMKLSDLVFHLQIIDPTQVYPETGLRDECIRRLAVSLDMPPEVLLGLGDVNHWCSDESTEILTKDRGWVTHDDLETGDVVRTLNHETGLAEWQPVLDIYRAGVTNEPMRRLESRTHSSLTTLNHRWPVTRLRHKDKVPYVSREWTTTKRLTAADSIITGAFAGDENLAVVPDDLVELAAWFWTEGHARGKTLSIAQSHTRNADRVERIRGCLTRLYGPSVGKTRMLGVPAWREAIQQNDGSHGVPITVFHLNQQASKPLLDIAPSKCVSPEFISALSRAQLELFIDVSCQGDGHHYRGGLLDVWQKDPARLDAFELAVILSGRAASRQPSHDGGVVVRALRSLAVRPVKAAQEAGRQFNDDGATDEIVSYSGVVWCPTTVNRTWLARRDGRTFFTGNSAWNIDEITWKYHLQPVADSLVQDLTDAYLSPYLMDQNIADWGKYVIAYDATAVINHPDRTKDAKDLHDRGVIGDEALRGVANFGDNDAPTEEERNRWLGVKLRDPSLAVYGVPSLRQNSELEPDSDTLVSPGPDGGTTGDGGVTAADVEKTPPVPKDDPAGVDNEVVASAQRAQTVMVQGAAQLALLRAREAAGSRLRTLARRDDETLALIEGVPARDVAATLGRARVRNLPNVPSEAALVGGARTLILDALRVFGITDDGVQTSIADTIEKHAARTLYDLKPQLMPDSFPQFVQGLLTAGK